MREALAGGRVVGGYEALRYHFLCTLSGPLTGAPTVSTIETMLDIAQLPCIICAEAALGAGMMGSCYTEVSSEAHRWRRWAEEALRHPPLWCTEHQEDIFSRSARELARQRPRERKDSGDMVRCEFYTKRNTPAYTQCRVS